MKPARLLVPVMLVAFFAHDAGAQRAKPRPPSPATATPAGREMVSLADSLTGQPKVDYEAARMLFGVSDFEGALIKFSAAYGATKDVRLLFNMATCESKLHHYARALGVMRTYLAEGGTMLSDQDRTVAEAAIKAFEPLTSTLVINVAEPGAIVSLDDQTVGQSSGGAQMLNVVIDIGVHRVRVTKPEFVDFATEVTVTGAVPITVDAKLARVVHEGKVIVRAGEHDTVALDGAPVGSGTWEGSVASGGHTLRVTAAGMTAYQTEVLVQDGQTRDIGVTLLPEPRKGLPLWTWITGGVVVAGGLGVGAYFLFKPSPATYTGPLGNVPPGLVPAIHHPHR